jgi:hypothetical protein
MNGTAAEIAYSAAVIHGELRRAFLAAAIVLLICVVCWAVQEFGLRKSTAALGWVGMLCLAGVASIAVILIVALI